LLRLTGLSAENLDLLPAKPFSEASYTHVDLTWAGCIDLGTMATLGWRRVLRWRKWLGLGIAPVGKAIAVYLKGGQSHFVLRFPKPSGNRNRSRNGSDYGSARHPARGSKRCDGSRADRPGDGAFGWQLDNTQIAPLATYVRTEFGGKHRPSARPMCRKPAPSSRLKRIDLLLLRFAW